jgi:hypothetical protein
MALKFDCDSRDASVVLRHEVVPYDLMCALAIDVDVQIYVACGDEYPEDSSVYESMAFDLVKKMSKAKAEAALKMCLTLYGVDTERWPLEEVQVYEFKYLLELARVWVMKKYRIEPCANVPATQWEVALGMEMGSVGYPQPGEDY